MPFVLAGAESPSGQIIISMQRHSKQKQTAQGSPPTADTHVTANKPAKAKQARTVTIEELHNQVAKKIEALLQRKIPPDGNVAQEFSKSINDLTIKLTESGRQPSDGPQILSALEKDLAAAQEFTSRIARAQEFGNVENQTDERGASLDMLRASTKELLQRCDKKLKQLVIILPAAQESAATPSLHDLNFTPAKQAKAALPKKFEDLSPEEMLKKLLCEETSDSEEEEQKKEQAKKQNDPSDPNNYRNNPKLQALKDFFDKLKINQAPVNIAQYGNSQKKDTDPVPIIASYEGRNSRAFKKLLATMFSEVLLPDSKLQELIIHIVNTQNADFHWVSELFTLSRPDLISGTLPDNEIVVSNATNYPAGLMRFPLSHQYQVTALSLYMRDGRELPAINLLECKLGGLLIEIPEGVEEIAFRVKSRPSDQKQYGLNSALLNLSPKAPKVFVETGDLKEMMPFVNREHLPALILEGLIAEGLQYCVGSEIHQLLEFAGKNWINFAMGFKAAGKCAQLATLLSAAFNNFDIPATTICGFNPEANQIGLNKGHAQTLLVADSELFCVDMTKHVELVGLNLKAISPEEYAFYCDFLAQATPQEAYEIGVVLNKKIVVSLDDYMKQLPQGQLQDIRDELEELSKNRAELADDFGSKPLPSEPGLDLKMLVKVSRLLKQLNELAQDPDAQQAIPQINKILAECDSIPVESARASAAKICKVLPRILLFNHAIKALSSPETSDQSRAAHLDSMTTLLADGIKIYYGNQGRYYTVEYLSSSQFFTASKAEFLTHLSAQEFSALCLVVEGSAYAKPGLDYFCQPLFNHLIDSSAVLTLGKGLLEEFKRRNAVPSREFCLALLHYEYSQQKFDIKDSRGGPIGGEYSIKSITPHISEPFVEALAQYLLTNWGEYLPKIINEADDKNYAQVKNLGPALTSQVANSAAFWIDDYVSNIGYSEHYSNSNYENWANRILYLSRITEAFQQLADGDFRYSTYSKELEGMVTQLLNLQNSIDSIPLNPPCPEFPFSNYLRRSSATNQTFIAACDKLIETGIIRPYQEFYPCQERSEAQLVELFCEKLKKHPYLAERLFSADKQALDNYKSLFNRGFHFALEAIAVHCPEANKIARFIRPAQHSNQELTIFREMLPREFEELSKNVFTYIQTNQAVLLEFLASQIKSESLQNSNQLALLFWAAEHWQKDKVKVQEANRQLAQLKDGINSPDSEIGAALHDLTMNAQQQLLFGSLSLRQRAIALQAVELIFNPNLSRPTDSAYNTPLVNNLLTALGINYKVAPLLLKLHDSAQSRRFGATQNMLVEAILAGGPPTSRTDTDRNKLLVPEVQKMISQGIEEADQEIIRSGKTMKGKGWIDYEHNLKAKNIKRFSRIAYPEFHTTRSYSPGDDLRNLNQRVYARTDHLVVNVKTQLSHEPKLCIVFPVTLLKEKPEAYISELMSQINFAAYRGVKKIDLVISMGVALFHFQDLTAKEDGKLRFRTTQFNQELAEALSTASAIHGDIRDALGNNYLAFALKREDREHTAYLLLEDQKRFHSTSNQDAELLTRTGATVFSISIRDMNLRYHKLHPEIREECNRKSRFGHYWI